MNATFPIPTETRIPYYLIIPAGVSIFVVCLQFLIISCFCIFWKCRTKEKKQQTKIESSPKENYTPKITMEPTAEPRLFFTESPTFTRETASDHSNANSPSKSPLLTFNKNTVIFHKSPDGLRGSNGSSDSNFCHISANSREHWV